VVVAWGGFPIEFVDIEFVALVSLGRSGILRIARHENP
jgi:hypothetical protein